jgi:hypothetical protein
MVLIPAPGSRKYPESSRATVSDNFSVADNRGHSIRCALHSAALTTDFRIKSAPESRHVGRIRDPARQIGGEVAVPAYRCTFIWRGYAPRQPPQTMILMPAIEMAPPRRSQRVIGMRSIFHNQIRATQIYTPPYAAYTRPAAVGCSDNNQAKSAKLPIAGTSNHGEPDFLSQRYGR